MLSVPATFHHSPAISILFDTLEPLQNVACFEQLANNVSPGLIFRPWLFERQITLST